MHQKLRILRTNLRQWNHSSFGSIFKDKEVVQKELESMHLVIMNHGYTDETKVKEKELLAWLNKRCEQEETLWKQKSRVDWIKEGERNTTFFHRSTVQHRMNIKIVKLKTDDGTILEEHADMEKELSGFYKLC